MDLKDARECCQNLMKQLNPYKIWDENAFRIGFKRIDTGHDMAKALKMPTRAESGGVDYNELIKAI